MDVEYSLDNAIKLAQDAAAEPNGKAEKVLEEMCFKALNGDFDQIVLKALISVLWMAFVFREKYVEHDWTGS